MSMDISQVPELVDNTGYPLLIEGYDSVPLVYPLVADVQPVDGDKLYGTKGSVITGMGELKPRLDGAEFERDQFRSGPTWYMKTHQWGSAFEIPDRMLKATDAAARVEGLIRSQVASWGRSTAMKKDRWFADFLQQGTLTAGNAAYFDGSFPNNDDPNPKFVYDGLPLFDTAHTITIGSSTYANHAVSSSLTKANLETAVRTCETTNAVDERGEGMLVNIDRLMVPPALRETALTIVGSELLPGSANNDINTARGSVQVIVNRWLDDAASASAWWLFDSGMGSIKVFDSGQPVIVTTHIPERNVTLVTAETYFGVVAAQAFRGTYCANKAAS